MATQSAKPLVVIIGGGFGGLEAAYDLRKRLPHEVDITLISNSDYFLFKPNMIYIPFGLDPHSLKVDLQGPARRKDITFVGATAQEINPEARIVTVNGYRQRYDYLIVATGASTRAVEIPGLDEYAQTIWTSEAMLQLRSSLNRLLEKVKSGKPQSILFLLPPKNQCPAPLYEMAFVVETWLRRNNIRERVELHWSTHEQNYLEALGPNLHDVVLNEFNRRGIQHHSQYAVEHVSAGGVRYRNGISQSYDLLIASPPHVAAAAFPGLPSDERGFIATDPVSRQVLDYPNIYAAGDAGDYPLKQAFLALRQADAITEHLHATIAEREPAFGFEPVSHYVLEQVDTATYVRVPLEQPDRKQRFKSGTSPLWRMGKRMIGTYLPWRFSEGEPVHGDLPWRGLETGMKLMSDLFAR